MSFNLIWEIEKLYYKRDFFDNLVFYWGYRYE